MIRESYFPLKYCANLKFHVSWAFMLCWLVNTYQSTLSKCLADLNFQQYGCENFLSGAPFLIPCILFPLLLIFTFIITDLTCDKLSVSSHCSKRTHPVRVVFIYFREAYMGWTVQLGSPFEQNTNDLHFSCRSAGKIRDNEICLPQCKT